MGETEMIVKEREKEREKGKERRNKKEEWLLNKQIKGINKYKNINR